MTSFEINEAYKAMGANTSNKAMSAARACHAANGTPTDVASAARMVLENAGGFGKDLDRKVRRMCKTVTGVDLQPGEGHGHIKIDGGVSYRG
jgi:hypothetical protein